MMPHRASLTLLPGALALSLLALSPGGAAAQSYPDHAI